MGSASHADIIGNLIEIDSKIPPAIAGQRESARYCQLRTFGHIAAVNLGAEFFQREIFGRHGKQMVPRECQAQCVHGTRTDQVRAAEGEGVRSRITAVVCIHGNVRREFQRRWTVVRGKHETSEY